MTINYGRHVKMKFIIFVLYDKWKESDHDVI